MNHFALPSSANQSNSDLLPASRSIAPTNSLAQQAPIGIVYLGLDGGISQANPAFCQLIGYTEAQLRRLDNQIITHPQDFAAELRVMQWLIEQGQGQHVLQKRYLCSNGSITWTQVKLSLTRDPETGEGVLLAFVLDLQKQKLAEQEIQQHREREALLNEIAAQLRTATDLQMILNIAVDRLRQALNTDRVLAYQFLPDQSGICLAESVSANYPSMLGQTFPPACIPPPHLEAYRVGRLWAVADVYDESLAECHQLMLEQVYVRSMLATAIASMDETLEPQKRSLWGLLVVHHCQGVRTWTVDEEQLIQAVANQLATALEHTKLLNHLQRQTQELEERVSQRTRSLERALKFERLIHRLTEALRVNLDEDQMLRTAVEGLVRALDADGCISSLFNPQRQELDVRYEFFGEGVTLQRSLIGHKFPLASWSSECCQHLLNRQTCCFYNPFTSPSNRCADPILDQVENNFDSTARAPIAAKLMSPIVDDQGLIGILTVLRYQPRQFEPDEITLVEQVASQCAIAVRQANLYRMEHELRLSSDYFRSFLEKSNDVFVEYDVELHYISINPAGSTLLERSPDEIIGKTNQQLLETSAESLDALIRCAIDTGEKVFVNHEIELPQGTRVFETVYAPITNPAGIVQRVIGVGRDVTELKDQWQLLENQNHQLAETTRLKEEFIATTSHELRTPLTAILGFSNVLLQEFFGTLNSKQKDYLERIHSSGQHLLDLINDILDLSRLEADRLELDLQTIFIPDICEGIMSLIKEPAQNQGLTVELTLDPQVDWMVVDPRRLKQMLLNLLTNAVKFTTEGTVGLKVYRQAASSSTNQSVTSLANKRSQLTSSDQATSEMIHFLVWDTGIGIDEVDQPLLFSPFSQIDSSLSRNYQGTGLGLVITRKLAELHGGSVSLKSSRNQGTCFIITLPLHHNVAFTSRL